MSDFDKRPALTGGAFGVEARDPPTATGHEELRKVVIVDDNHAAAAALGDHLQAAGNQVLVTHSGKEAWQVCKDFAPSAMIVNVGLPRLNGFQLARRVRRTGWGVRAVLIAVSGSDRSGDTQLAKFVGFDHFCDKSIDFTEIARLVQ